MRETPDGIILLPHLHVQNTNAISGPLTWGFPAPTAFAGFVHALNRKFGSAEIRLDGAGIVCHRFDPQVYRPGGSRYQPYRFSLARHPHPVEREDKQTRGITEEGRAHLDVSLLIGVHGYIDEFDGQAMADKLYQAALGMRLAGGSIMPPDQNMKDSPNPKYYAMSGTMEGDSMIFKKLRRRLLPGFALISRHELLMEHLRKLQTEQPDREAGIIDALLDLTRLNIEPVRRDNQSDDNVEWSVSRRYSGWLVPLPAGYGAISPLYESGAVANARDNQTPFRLVETIYSLGEWVGPHRLDHPQQLLWYHRAQPDDGLYLIEQQHTTITGG